jgi:UDP-N-acetylglucosamine 1-carboxyvinyltransferase
MGGIMNDIVRIRGQKRLNGTISINGSKNSVVALIPASLLAKDVVTFTNVPHIEDVNSLLTTLSYLNVKTKFDGQTLTIDSSKISNKPLIGEEIKKVRASYYFMGALLALFNEVVIREPGGCSIGERPIDLHISGFEKMNVEVNYQDHIYTCKTPHLIGQTVVLKKVSVGATINLMIAMALADGVSIIENAAREPEIIDVANLINHMGGCVKGAGTSTIIVVGASKLRGCSYRVIPDRIETGTYAIIGAALGDEVFIENCNTNHCLALIYILKKIGVNLTVYDDVLIIKKSTNLTSINVETNPYPEFPTDLQQPLTTLLTQANGISIIKENIYAKRTAHVIELNKMGANIEVYDNNIIIKGPTLLKGCQVSGKDLRGGASLVLAALLAEGESYLHGFRHIKRGYDNIVNKLNKLGADISFIKKGDNDVAENNNG